MRLACLVYAGIAYLLALLNIAYLIGFIADFGVPKGINDGAAGPIGLSILIDAGLIALFGLHHSSTARRSFKRWWTGYLPPAMERATYLYMTAVMSCVLVVFWQPVPITVWQVDNGVFAAAIVVAYLITCAMMLAATFHFGHFHFFGLQQAWSHFRQVVSKGSTFSARYLYALVRHPIGLGWMLMPWLTPHMSVGQVVYAVAIAAYVLVATRFEEADLIEELGDDYRRYRRRVPAFIVGRH